ncbi:MAG: ferritin-like domain-containing protein [Solirubrobacteraceae bacterium]
MITRTRSQDFTRSSDHVGPSCALVCELTAAYWHEIEMVRNYATSSTNRDGISAEQVADAVRDAITSALKHAQQAAIRIRQLHAAAPDPADFDGQRRRLRPPAAPLDNALLLTRMIQAETAAIERYRRIAAIASEACDWVTQALMHQVIHEKTIHRQSLQNFLRDRPEGRRTADPPGGQGSGGTVP